MMERKEAKWHVLMGELAKPGTLVVHSLRLIHGATPNESKVRFAKAFLFSLLNTVIDLGAAHLVRHAISLYHKG